MMYNEYFYLRPTNRSVERPKANKPFKFCCCFYPLMFTAPKLTSLGKDPGSPNLVYWEQVSTHTE